MEYQTEAFTLLELFRLGGITMWPLTAYSIATLAIGLERIIYLSYHNLQIDDMGAKVSQMMAEGDYDGAAEYLAPQTKRRMGARILLAMVNRARDVIKAPGGFSEKPVERTTTSEATVCINSLESGFNFLVALGSIAPLTGFLGTVTGMISAFRAIAEATDVNPQVVAGGINEALITTVYGLIVAIFAMVFHTIFSNIVDRFAARVEKNCSDLIAEIADQQARSRQVQPA
ncbi:MAG: MotA/TolQ/ExbB proton channel family protein [Treponema sp.]|nr:MotA/TolQ/ExbB proton channel family protein [Treponema sp.]